MFCKLFVHHMHILSCSEHVHVRGWFWFVACNSVQCIGYVRQYDKLKLCVHCCVAASCQLLGAAERVDNKTRPSQEPRPAYS